MRRRYYRRHKKEDPIVTLLGLFGLFLIFLWFTDKATFWRWVVYSVVATFIIIGGLLIIERIKGGFSRRNRSTPEAQKLGGLLKRLGWNVEFEKYDNHKHIDLAIEEAKTYIEVEGSHHNWRAEQALTDLKRDSHSEEDGYETIRVPNSVIRDKGKIDELIKVLDEKLKRRKNKKSMDDHGLDQDIAVELKDEL